jgi:hypothetical protein
MWYFAAQVGKYSCLKKFLRGFLKFLKGKWEKYTKNIPVLGCKWE